MSTNAFKQTLFLVFLILAAILNPILPNPKTAYASEQNQLVGYFSRALTPPGPASSAPSSQITSQSALPSPNTGIIGSLVGFVKRLLPILTILLLIYVGFKVFQFISRQLSM